MQSVIIGTRIDFTSNDEISLASNKPAVSLLIKLLDQEVSIAVAELTSLNTKGDKVCEIQGKID